MATKNKSRGRDRDNRPDEDVTAEDAQEENATVEEVARENARRRKETRQRREDDTARHGKPPPVRGLQGEEPVGQDPTGRDKREGVISRHTFRHVEKGEHHKPKREEDG